MHAVIPAQNPIPATPLLDVMTTMSTMSRNHRQAALL